MNTLIRQHQDPDITRHVVAHIHVWHLTAAMAAKAGSTDFTHLSQAWLVDGMCHPIHGAGSLPAP